MWPSITTLNPSVFLRFVLRSCFAAAFLLLCIPELQAKPADSQTRLLLAQDVTGDDEDAQSGEKPEGEDKTSPAIEQDGDSKDESTGDTTKPEDEESENTPEDVGEETEESAGENDAAEDRPETTENTNKPADDPEVLTDLELLPFPTRKMRQLIYDAAKSGDIEKLRPYIGYGDDVTMLSLGGFDEDPIEFLKSISGDSEGHELLAIITEILDAGFVLMDEGTEREVYVWPYFFAHSLETLTPEQRVQLFRLITYGDYQDMESFGAYIFYRLGITPEGRWRFFVAGD